MSLVKPCNVVSECVNAQVTNHKNECNEWDMEESMIHTKAAKMCECGREGKGREGKGDSSMRTDTGQSLQNSEE
jgi:hypothetical protein